MGMVYCPCIDFFKITDGNGSPLLRGKNDILAHINDMCSTYIITYIICNSLRYKRFYVAIKHISINFYSYITLYICSSLEQAVVAIESYNITLLSLYAILSTAFQTLEDDQPFP
tara:strand:- start:387 stop:728 length:342 start_codon:yes stop_codon:yes gene_type:complete